MTDANSRLEVYVLVNDQKVFFSGVNPKASDSKSLKFSTDFTLKEGNNTVLVVARETPDFASRRMLVIRRRPAAMAQQVAAPTPPQAPPTQRQVP